jgi:hypothetical protein
MCRGASDWARDHVDGVAQHPQYSVAPGAIGFSFIAAWSLKWRVCGTALSNPSRILSKLN